MKISDKDILMIDKNGSVVKVFKNFSDATDTIGLKGRSLISRICKKEYGSCLEHYWLLGKSYNKKIKTSTYNDWVKSNVSISKPIDRKNAPIIKLDRKSYAILDSYPSLEVAAKINGFDNKNGYDSIIKSLKLTRRSAKGYIWVLKEDYDNLGIDGIKQKHNEINNTHPLSKKINKYTMPVLKLNKTTYEPITRYESIEEAVVKNDINRKSGYDGIVRCCRFTRKSSSGYCWILEEDYNKMSKEEIIERYESDTVESFTYRHSFDTTPIVQLNKKTFEYIKVYNSINEASKDIGVNSGGISKCCKFQRRSSGGYCWMYLDDFRKYSLDEIKDKYSNIFWN